MSRVDVPTLECDRCHDVTQDLTEMGRYQRLTHPHLSGTEEWDLCLQCWIDFVGFLQALDGA